MQSRTPTRRMVLPITEAKSVQRGPLAPNSEQLSHSIPPSSFLIRNVCHDEIEHAVFDGIDTPEEVPNGILAQHATFEVLRQEPQFVRPEISLPFIAGIIGIKFQDVILKFGDCSTAISKARRASSTRSKRCSISVIRSILVILFY